MSQDVTTLGHPSVSVAEVSRVFAGKCDLRGVSCCLLAFVSLVGRSAVQRNVRQYPTKSLFVRSIFFSGRT